MEKRPYPRKQYHHLFSRNIGPGDRYYECLPYRTIVLSRTPSLGRSPVEEITLHRHGHGRYEGTNNVELLGTFIGDFEINDFGKICYLIDVLGIESLRSRYRLDSTCRSSTIVRLVRADATEKSVEDYGNSGPIELWALQQVIASVAQRVRWRLAPPPRSGGDGSPAPN